MYPASVDKKHASSNIYINFTVGHNLLSLWVYYILQSQIETCYVCILYGCQICSWTIVRAVIDSTVEWLIVTKKIFIWS